MRGIKSEIPEAATEVVTSTYPDGTKNTADYYLGGEQVGYRSWDEDGQLDHELSLHDGRRHGPERTWHDNGNLMHETHWVKGLEHGTSRQWNRKGELVCTYEMDHGTGMDIWVNGGKLAEERYECDGSLHGYERWWSGDDATVFKESHYKMSVLHGIWREWNTHGRLCRGFPKYFIDGRQVKKRQYLAAASRDVSLPPFRPEDNDPHRQMSEAIRQRYKPSIGPWTCSV